MKNSLIKRMYAILIITTLLASGWVYVIVYFTSQNSLRVESLERAMGIKEYILRSLDSSSFVDIGEYTEAGRNARQQVQGILDNLMGIGGLKRLYIASINEEGEIVTTNSTSDSESAYIPTGNIEADLRRSINERIAITGERFYRTDEGRVFTIFWPVTDQQHQLLGVVCMEFDVDFLSHANTRALTYGLFMSVGFLLIISLISYLSLSRASEPYFKKLAYTDFLTGYENRMAFEQKLRECGNLVDKGERVTLIICDVNNLKTVNDTLGHKVGDTYIKNTADVIAENLGDQGLLYRIGGDEFAVIIVGSSEAELEELMLALREDNSQVVRGHQFSCACGAATFTPGLDGTLRDVFKRADDAMYKEKKRQKAEKNLPLRA